MRYRRRGASLAFVFLLLTLAVSLCVAIMVRFEVRLRVTRHMEFSRQAEHLAESGIAAVIARTRADRKWGTTADTYSMQETIPHPSDSKAGFFLTFDPGKPNRSINNLLGDTPLPVEKPVCPTGCLYVISTGHCNGQQATLSAVISVPPYPYALASTGPIRSDGGFLMGAVRNGWRPEQGLESRDLEKAELMTQGQDDAEGAALLLKGVATIVGTARSAGSVDYDKQQADITRAEIIPNSPKEELPKIPLAELTTSGDIQTIPRSNFSELEKLSGQLQFTGSQLHFQRGLQLNGATLRVKGNLVIDGPVTGSGALVVDGDVTLRGGAKLSADNQVAIVSTGSVVVKGENKETSFFQGLIYAEGSRGISLTDTTVIGTVLSTGESSPGVGAPLQVDRATVALNQQGASPSIDLSATGVNGGGGLQGARMKKPLPLSSFYQDGAWHIPPNSRPPQTPANPLPFSPLESALLPYLELKINGVWYASVEEARAAGIAPDKIQGAVLAASTIYANQLAEVSSRPPAENPQLSFQLDLNKYLQTSGRLRVVKVSPL